MKTVLVYTLIAVNIVLGVTLLARFGKEQTAVGQAAAPGAAVGSARPSDYQMVPGTIVGSTDAVIYILDQTNGLLGAMVFNGASGQFDIMQPIELSRLMDARLVPSPNPARNGGMTAPRR